MRLYRGEGTGRGGGAARAIPPNLSEIPDLTGARIFARGCGRRCGNKTYQRGREIWKPSYDQSFPWVGPIPTIFGSQSLVPPPPHTHTPFQPFRTAVDMAVIICYVTDDTRTGLIIHMLALLPCYALHLNITPILLALGQDEEVAR